jgi:hypothetical protein
MSIDFKIFAICDHRIHREFLAIDSDNRTLRIPRVTSSSNNISLYVNGNLIKSDNPIYNYTIQTDENSVDFKKLKIVFNKPVKFFDNFYEISYSVFSNLCPKCTGQKIINDESYNTLGQINIVQNEEKILQEVKKGLLTVLGSNPFHSWIGTRINTLIGSKIFNIDSLKANLIQEVSNYLERYLDVQYQQARFQEVTDREAFGQIILIDAAIDPIEPTLLTLTVIFRNRTGADLAFEKKVTIPASSVNAQFFNLR